LTSATYTGTPAESYAYDVVGNRTSSHRSSSYSYEPFNRLTSTTAASYLYNSNGNMISKADSSGTTQFAWDFENRLIQAVTPSSGSVSYKYDALGRRIQSAPSSGFSTNFTYDGQDVAQDKTSAGVITEYLNSPGIDNKIRQKIGTTLYYFAQDHLGSTTALTDSKGALVERETYDAYGNTAGTAKTRYGFTGRERDSLTGLQYNRARFYDPQLGRFISEDPIGLNGGLNFYAYVENSPINATDPSGLCTDPEYCRKLLLQIVAKTNGFFNAFGPYKDSGFVDAGGKPWSHGGKSGTTKPGGHYNEITGRQRGLMKDILEYIENCIKKGDPPPPELRRAFDAAKTPVPWPVNIPTQEELRLQIEANRQMAEFWRKILLGSIGGGAIIVGGPEVIPALPRILWFIPAFAP
jgi:RHS repeat-associated protein